MSTATVIVVIACLLGALVAYALISQSLAVRREQRQRLLLALRARARSSKRILNGLPEAYVTSELSVLVQRNMVEVCNQLLTLEPGISSHRDDLEWAASLNTLASQERGDALPPPLDSLPQIKETRAALEELHEFLVAQEERDLIPKNKALHFKRHLKLLALQLSVDTQEVQARQAKVNGKASLAHHHFTIARNLIARENAESQFSARLERFNTEMEALQPDRSECASDSTDSDPHEWQDYTSDGDWKKRQVYD